MTRLVLISDTHGKERGLRLPAGDILIHAGDLTKRGTLRELASVTEWLGELDFASKVVIAGNHDHCFERSAPAAREMIGEVAHYLEDDLITLGGLRIYGSPWQPRFFNWAFNLPRGEPLREKWRKVPTGVDVLVTHGPPMGMLDCTRFGKRVGCEALTEELERIAPRIHTFGHIHEDYGVRLVRDTMYVNASTCDLRYKPVQPPVCVDIDDSVVTLISGGS